MIIPVLKDAGEIGSQFGQLVAAAGSIADFGAIILLSVLFAGEGGTGTTLVLIGGLFALAFVVFVVVRGAERSMRIRDDLLRLQDTTAQIRIGGAEAAELIAAGLLSVLLFPLIGSVLLRGDGSRAPTDHGAGPTNDARLMAM